MSAAGTSSAHLTLEEVQRKAAAKFLKEAAKMAAFHAAKHKPLSFRMGSGKAAPVVLMAWPGVLTVVDPKTCNVLAVSEPGKPDTLKGQP